MTTRLRRIRETYIYRKAFKRLHKVPISQVSDWANSSLWTTQMALESGDLDQAALGAVGLLAAIDTLLDTMD